MTKFSSQPVGQPVAQCTIHDEHELILDVKDRRTRKPLKGVVLALTPSAAPAKKTGRTGRVVFEHLSAGSLSVTSTDTDYRVFPERGADPTARHHHFLAVKQKQGNLRVKVTGGGPIPSYEESPHGLHLVAVVLKHKSRKPRKPRRDRTNPEGVVVFKHLKPGSYTVELVFNTKAGRARYGERAYYKVPDPKKVKVVKDKTTEHSVVAKRRSLKAAFKHLDDLHHLGVLPQEAFTFIPEATPEPKQRLTDEQQRLRDKQQRLREDQPRLERIMKHEFTSVIIYVAWAATCSDKLNPSPQTLAALRFNFNPPKASEPPIDGTFDERADKAIAFAKAATLTVNATPLLWFHAQHMPTWVDSFPGIRDPAAFDATFKDLVDHHFRNVIGHYRRSPGATGQALAQAQIESWVVVNEPFNLVRRQTRRPKMKDRAVWKPFLGHRTGEPKQLRRSAVTAIVYAFERAHAWAGDVPLILNEYQNETWAFHPKDYSQEFFELLQEVRRIIRSKAEDAAPSIKANAEKLRGLIAAGFQCHLKIPRHVIDMSPTKQRHELRDAANAVGSWFQKFKDNNIKVYVTELSFIPAHKSKAARRAQGIAYEEFIRAVKTRCHAIYLWGMNDKYADKVTDKNNPFLFDSEFRPKPAYIGMRRGAARRQRRSR